MAPLSARYQYEAKLTARYRYQVDIMKRLNGLRNSGQYCVSVLHARAYALDFAVRPLSGTGIAYVAVGLRACCAVCGTDIACSARRYATAQELPLPGHVPAHLAAEGGREGGRGAHRS
eukprot:3332547-Rhodomonas_salina.1